MLRKLIGITATVVLSACISASAAVPEFDEAKELIDILSDGYELTSTEEVVTRSEFVTLLLNIDKSNYSGPTDKMYFSDIDAESAFSGTVKSALDKKMISPGAKFFPNEAVTYEQAVKMAVSLAGYSVAAEMEGGFPMGYINKAAQLEMLEGLDKIDNSPITRTDAYILAYNTVHADYMVAESVSGNVEYVARDGENILSIRHSIYEYEGIVTADSKTSLENKNGKVLDGYFRIGNELFRYNTAKKLLGYNVRLYYRETEGELEALLVYKEDNNEFVLSSSDYKNMSGTDIYYYNEDKTEKIEVKTNAKIIKNFQAYTPEDTEALFLTPDSKFTFIDNDNDDIYDVIKVLNYKYVHISAIDSVNGRIYDKNSSDNTLELSEDKCEYDLFEEYYDGRFAITLDDLTVGSLLCYIETPDKSYYELDVLNNPVSGVITSVTESEIEIEGVWYELNSYAVKNYLFRAGDKGKFQLGIDNTVVSYEKARSEIEYGWVSMFYRDDASGGEDFMIKIFAEDGKMHYYKMAEKIILDGVNRKVENAENDLIALKNSSDTRRLVRYSLNSDGEVKMIDTCEDAGTIKTAFDDTDVNNSMKIFYEQESGLQYKRTSAIFGRKIKLDDTTVIFAIPSDDDKGDANNYGILPLSYFVDDDKTQVITSYDMDKESAVSGAILITAKAATSDPDLTSVYVVERKLEAMNSEEEPCYMLEVCSKDGTYAKFFTNERIQEQMASVDKGDIIRVDLDAKGRVNAIVVDYDLSAGIINRAASSELEYQNGYFNSFDGTTATLIQSTTIDIKDEEAINNFNAKDLFVTRVSKAIVIEVLKENDVVEKVYVHNTPVSGIRTVQNSAGDADYAIIYHRYWAGNTAFIYRYIN